MVQLQILTETLSLDVADNAMLEVSYIGYKSQELQAVAGKTLSVTLREDTEVLDEVVVVGILEL